MDRIAKTAGTRETARKAKAELQRRGHEPAPAETPQPQSTLEWWQELQANIEAADRALVRQQQATSTPVSCGRQSATRSRNWKLGAHPNLGTPCLNGRRFSSQSLIVTASA